MAKRGAVAASDPQTALAARQVLDAGGTAIDAIVAAAFASFVVEPPLTSPAGGGALLHGSSERGWELVDCMATTPGLGLVRRPDLDFLGVEVDFGPTTQVFHVGRGSVAVPGLLRGLIRTHERWGRIPLATLLEPAIGYARDGFVLGQAIHWVHELLEPILTLTPSIRALTCDARGLAPAGSLLRNPAMAGFFEALGADVEGALDAYHQALVGQFGPSAGGLLTHEDLRVWEPAIREPLRVGWLGHDVLLNPPPSAGGGLVGFALKLFARDDLGGAPYQSPAHLEAVAGALGQISALRASGYDDRLADRAAIEAYLSDASIEEWAQRAAADAEERHLGSTTHISVADGAGGAAGLTTSNGEGCGTVLDGFGVHVNNFLGEEDINPAGFHNFAPGQRMSTMMSPTIALRDAEPVLVVGSGGSNRIRSAVFQALVNRLAFHRPLDEAVNADRLHVEGGRLWFEATHLEPLAIAALERWPATRFDAQSMFFGGVHGVARDGEAWIGAGDRRRGGVSA